MNERGSDMDERPPEAMPPLPSLDGYLARMVEMSASDLFLRGGASPAYRVDGRIVRTDLPAPNDQQVREYVEGVLTPVARKRFAESPDMDVACDVPGAGRFRLNLFMERGSPAIAARLIPPGAVEFDTLNLPHSVLEMADARSGIVLVVGPTGCGKSTTLAALLHHVNVTRDEHIVTIEDPIEFVHEEQRCLIHQRQVGYDTESFATALRHVVRQSPDVILIGEMRDRESMQTALSAALTGHLIFTTLHTRNVVQSIERMLAYFPPEAREQVRTDLAATLVGIVSMRLLPRADGRGRVPAAEVLRASPTVRRLITDGELVEIYDMMKRSGDEGMTTLNESLVELVRSGKVRREDAAPVAPNIDEFRLNLEGMYTGIESIDLRTEDERRERRREREEDEQ